jgi:hypothetical protein
MTDTTIISGKAICMERETDSGRTDRLVCEWVGVGRGDRTVLTNNVAFPMKVAMASCAKPTACPPYIWAGPD